VDGVIYASEALIKDVLSGGGPAQVMNVATLPGIVQASLAMRTSTGATVSHRRRGGDGHREWRRGLARRVGYDINCGCGCCGATWAWPTCGRG